MIRAFSQHESRRVVDLEGVWEFRFLGDTEADSVDPVSVESDDRIAVPGCFDASPRYAGKRGLVVYRKGIFLSDATRHRITFNGVHHWCRVFLVQRGKAILLGEHACGFTLFAYDITGHVAGSAEIVLFVDNRFDSKRCPTHLDYFDWYHYGGITRSVELERLGARWIDSVRIETLDLESRRVRFAITCGSELREESSIGIEIDGTRSGELPVTLEPGGATVTTELDLEGAALWSPDAPVLHTARLRLGEDDLIERFGIRTVEAIGAEIHVNGVEVRLLGFCRHEAHPQFGCGLPAAIQIEDLQLLEELGCNFVRGSHYPQDPRFLDLCDERGILVWDEATGWQHHAEHFAEPTFIEAQLSNIREMIASSANHPSVILWGLQNESQSNDPANRAAYERLIGEIRSLDSTRPVTYASNRWPNDVMHDLVDVIAINTYPGWYHGGLDEIPKHLDAIVIAIDASTSKGKPLIMSEIGAGAVPGWRDRNRGRWSEEYQAELLTRVIRYLFVDRDRYCGLAIWQFSDCRSAELVSRTLGRPRGFNNKGVVDEYRKPKLGFDAVKRAFAELTRR